MSEIGFRMLHVVGDQFAAFADQLSAWPGENDVYTVSALILAFASGTLDHGGQIRLVPGQGVSLSDLDRLLAAATRSRLAGRVELADRPDPVTAREVHKRSADNVLVAGLSRVSPEEYRARLQVSPRNEFVIDHTTGSHIQGMILIEAARQMMIAVTEYYIRPSIAMADCGYVMTGINSTFDTFLFPLGAELRMRFDVIDVSRPRRPTFTATVTVHQENDQPAASCQAHYFLLPAEVVARRERMLAGDTVQRWRAQAADEIVEASPVPATPATVVDELAREVAVG
jgi:hypothetical protein